MTGLATSQVGTALDYGVAFDAGFMAGLDYVSDAPTAHAFTADAVVRALDVRRARQAADERLRRLDAAQGASPAEYARERAAQGLVAYDMRGTRASWNEFRS